MCVSLHVCGCVCVLREVCVSVKDRQTEKSQNGLIDKEKKAEQFVRGGQSVVKQAIEGHITVEIKS